MTLSTVDNVKMSGSLRFPSVSKQSRQRPGWLSRRLITLIFAGRNRRVVIRRELPRTSGAGGRSQNQTVNSGNVFRSDCLQVMHATLSRLGTELPLSIASVASASSNSCQTPAPT